MTFKKQPNWQFYNIVQSLEKKGIKPQYESVDSFIKRGGKILMCPDSDDISGIIKFRKKHGLKEIESPLAGNKNGSYKATNKEKSILEDI